MALVYCTKCGHRVSTTAPRCPGCGTSRHQNPVSQVASQASDIPNDALKREQVSREGFGRAAGSRSSKACPFCAETILATAKKCRFCGEFLDEETDPVRSSKAGSIRPVGADGSNSKHRDSAFVQQKDSGIVTALSVVGLVFGLIGMFGSFVPLLGAFAFFVAIPAAIVSAMALGVAHYRDAKRTFAIVALTISLIGVAVSTLQFAGLILPAATEDAKRAKAKADIAELKTALDRYYLDNGYYPTTGQGLAALASPPTGGPLPSDYEKGGYIERLPLDPWGHPYFYQSDGRSYVLRSFGADGKPGGEGKNADIDGSSS